MEHPLALMCKASAKQCRGRKAYAVYDAARQAGLVANFGSFGLPALTLACVSDGLLAEAVSVCDDARSATPRRARTTTRQPLCALALITQPMISSP